MAAFAQNNFVKSLKDGIAFRLDSAATILQGQFIKFVAATGLIEPATATADGSLCVGISEFSAPLPKVPFGSDAPFPIAAPNPLPGGPTDSGATGVVLNNGEFNLPGRAAETYKPLLAVVIDAAPDAPAVADGQHIRLYNAGGGDTTAQIVGYVSPSRIPAAGILGNAQGGVPFLLTPNLLRGNNIV